MVLSAWPGSTQVTISTLSPAAPLMRIMSTFAMPSALAVAGETYAALSQLMQLSGSGSSSIQGLLAWRPSNSAGSAAKLTSRLCAAGRGDLGQRLDGGGHGVGGEPRVGAGRGREVTCQAQVQSALPLLLEAVALEQLAGGAANQGMGAPEAHASEQREQLGIRAAAAQRRDQRLLDAVGAVAAAQVAPALELRWPGHVPAGEQRGLVAVLG